MATVKQVANVSGVTVPAAGLYQIIVPGVKGAKSIRLELSGGSNANALDILTCVEVSDAAGARTPAPSTNATMVSGEALQAINGAEGAGFHPVFLPSANPCGVVCTPYVKIAASVVTADATGVRLKVWAIFDTPAEQDTPY